MSFTSDQYDQLDRDIEAGERLCADPTLISLTIQGRPLTNIEMMQIGLYLQHRRDEEGGCCGEFDWCGEHGYCVTRRGVCPFFANAKALERRMFDE